MNVKKNSLKGANYGGTVELFIVTTQFTSNDQQPKHVESV